MAENVKIINLDEFDLNERQILDKLSKEYGPKIIRSVKNGLIILHPKKHEKGGRARYSINLRIETPEVLFGSKATDWDLARTLHKVFNKAENEVKKRFKL